MPLCGSFTVTAPVMLLVSVCAMHCSEDVREAREFLDGLGLQHCRVLAKIETRQSLLNFRGILSTADGIIVSRCGVTKV
jgi:pyruvate kinase